jgi:hypothetical protein
MNEKEQWVIAYLKSKEYLQFIDILDEEFVNAFIDKFDAKFEHCRLGSPKCKELSKLLSSMYKKQLLDSHSHGTKSGLTKDGSFPKWTYLYELKS